MGGERRARGACARRRRESSGGAPGGVARTWPATVPRPAVTKPVLFGGLGVPDMRLMGMALQARWLCLQRCPDDKACSALPIKVEPVIHELVQASILFVVGDGRSVLFWVDCWLDGKSVPDIAPNLPALVSSRVRTTQTVADALHQGRWIRELTGGLTVPAIVDYLRLAEALRGVRLQPLVQDVPVWRWTSNGRFTVKSTYQLLHEGSTCFPKVAALWKIWASLRRGDDATERLIGGVATGCKRTPCATSAAQRKRPVITCSLDAPSHGKCGRGFWRSAAGVVPQ
ncbi:hypothetical protein U9M48_037932 [Paspalum notatum var. saurae]|uniref:Uncharacterized protein n=1 Tax=Paspalum notatum var. saurae TaxID=547442 RepID=A0AAQ3X9U9_PASNO